MVVTDDYFIINKYKREGFFWAITMVGVISRVKRKAGRRRPASPTRQRERGKLKKPSIEVKKNLNKLTKPNQYV